MPSFVTLTGPGSAEITDDAAAAITAMSTAIVGAINASTAAIVGGPGMSGSLYAINNSLANITGNTGDASDVAKSLSKALKDLDASLMAMTSALAVQNSLQATLVANTIKTNNFQVQATKEALERTGQPVPVEPPIKEQLLTNVKDSITLTETAVASGAIITQVAATASTTGDMIAATEVYKTVAGWLDTAKTAVISVLPPSVQTALTKTSSQTATPSK